MRNLANVTGQNLPVLVESGAVTKRIGELHTNPLKIKNSSTLLDIHKYLLQDVYSWAGKIQGDVENLSILILELIASPLD